MDPQAFANQLEEAVISQDQDRLDELASIAGENPETQEIWETHHQLESAIQDWLSTPIVSNEKPSTIVAPQQSSARVIPYSQRVLAASAAVLLLLGISRFDRNRPDLNTENSVAVAAQTDATPTTPLSVTPESLTENQSESEPAPLDSLVAVTNQAGADTFMIRVPVVAGVGNEVSRNLADAWGILSQLPNEVEKAYQDVEILLPTSNGSEETQEEMPATEFSTDLFGLFS